MLSGIGSHFPCSISAKEYLFEVFELVGSCAVVVLGSDNDLVAPDVDLARERLKGAGAGFGSI